MLYARVRPVHTTWIPQEAAHQRRDTAGKTVPRQDRGVQDSTVPDRWTDRLTGKLADAAWVLCRSPLPGWKPAQGRGKRKVNCSTSVRDDLRARLERDVQARMGVGGGGADGVAQSAAGGCGIKET